jgi:hypothetical protein
MREMVSLEKGKLYKKGTLQELPINESGGATVIGCEHNQERERRNDQCGCVSLPTPDELGEI